MENAVNAATKTRVVNPVILQQRMTLKINGKIEGTILLAWLAKTDLLF
jgi:hypothetical protein